MQGIDLFWCKWLNYKGSGRKRALSRRIKHVLPLAWLCCDDFVDKFSIPLFTFRLEVVYLEVLEVLIRKKKINQLTTDEVAGPLAVDFSVVANHYILPPCSSSHVQPTLLRGVQEE